MAEQSKKKRWKGPDLKELWKPVREKWGHFSLRNKMMCANCFWKISHRGALRFILILELLLTLFPSLRLSLSISAYSVPGIDSLIGKDIWKARWKANRIFVQQVNYDLSMHVSKSACSVWKWEIILKFLSNNKLTIILSVASFAIFIMQKTVNKRK